MLSQERLEGGFAAPEGVEAKDVGVQIDFATNEAVSPERVNRKDMPEQTDVAVFIGASKEDKSALGRRLKILLPGFREGSSRRRDQGAFGATSSGGGDEPGGLILERFKGVEVEASPDFGLPAAVVAFDGGLEARLARRREDGRDLEGEADPADAPEVVGVMMGTLEPGVVVELCVSGQTKLAPVFEQGGHADPSGDRGSGPGSRQAAVKRDGVKDLHIDSAFNDKAFDDIEAIDLDLFGSDLWQVPAAGRSRPAHSSVPIQSSSPFQDSSNGANRRDLAVPLPSQLAVDRGVTVLSQVAGLPKLLSQPEDFLFESRGDAISGLTSRSREPVEPIDAVQPLPIRPTDPAVHRRGAQPKDPSDGSERTTSANSRNRLPTELIERVFLKSSPLLSATEQITAARSNRFALLRRGQGPMEADGVWKAAEYGPFPHPLENASRFPQLPQAQLPLNVLEKRTRKSPGTVPGLLTVRCSAVADSYRLRSKV